MVKLKENINFEKYDRDYFLNLKINEENLENKY